MRQYSKIQVQYNTTNKYMYAHSDNLRSRAIAAIFVIEIKGMRMLPLIATFFRNGTSFRPVIVPQTSQYLSGNHFTHVHGNKTHEEQSIATQVVLSEPDQSSGFSLGRCRIESAQLLRNISYLGRPIQCAINPVQHVANAENRDEDEPEPDKDEEFLVEQVYGEHTLDYVAVQASLVAYGEVAQSYSGKALGNTPVLTTYQLLDDTKSVHVIVDTEDCIEKEELTHGVGHIDGFNEEVGADQVIAVETTSN